jgi:putative heme iron utilization protein
MAEPENLQRPGGDKASAPWQARRLLRAARVGSLATSADGQPFASLITPSCAPDLSVLMLLSSLSEHTRHLRADPRCAIMVTGAQETANPQTAPRITITGLAELEPDAGLKARWLLMHPYAAMYADFGDFALYRVRPMAGQLVGGFARAFRLKAADLAPDPGAVAALLEAEADICAHCNDDHADTMALIAGGGGAWRMVAADVDGCDLAQGDIVRRIAWSNPVSDAMAVRSELAGLARVARAGQQ